VTIVITSNADRSMYYPQGSRYNLSLRYVAEGRWTVWHDNGNKHTEMSFAFGLLNGPFKFWNKEGELLIDGRFKGSKEVGSWMFKDNDGNRINRPKDLYFDITDDGKSIAILGQTDKEKNDMEFYVSIYIPLAIALLILLPLLGFAMYWLYRWAQGRRKDK